MNLIERLDKGPIVCAEGYLFAMERRGYLQAGTFVPEVVLEHPEVVTTLHREFIRAGSDVVHCDVGTANNGTSYYNHMRWEYWGWGNKDGTDFQWGHVTT